MSRLVWHEPGSNLYEAGVDRGVIYPPSTPGVVWNGLLSVVEGTSDADVKAAYLDGHRYHQKRSPGSFTASIEALSVPNELSDIFGLSSPNRRLTPFGLSYRVGSGQGHKIHLVYNATLRPSSRTYSTLAVDAELSTLTWDITTRPNPIGANAATAHIVIDTRVAHEWTVAAIEEVLYGSDILDSSLPSPDDVLELFEANSIVRITDHGDGTWSAEGPDEAIKMLDANTFEIDWPSAVYISQTAYTIQSL